MAINETVLDMKLNEETSLLRENTAVLHKSKTNRFFVNFMNEWKTRILFTTLSFLSIIILLSIIDSSQFSLQDFKPSYFSLKHPSLKKISDKTSASVGCEATILIIRHCEKDHSERHCNYLGFERAEYLSTLFGSRWPIPSYLFAYGVARKHKKVYREIETLLPISQKSNLNITSNHGSKSMAKKIHKLLKSGEICGKVALICWKHSEIPKLAQRIGCGPYEGCPLDYPSNTFDQAWQVKFVYGHGKKKKKGPKWWVFGSVSKQNFDPLQYSYLKGDYPEGGKEKGGSWYSPNLYGMHVLDGMK